MKVGGLKKKLAAFKEELEKERSKRTYYEESSWVLTQQVKYLELENKNLRFEKQRIRESKQNIAKTFDEYEAQITSLSKEKADLQERLKEMKKDHQEALETLRRSITSLKSSEPPKSIRTRKRINNQSFSTTSERPSIYLESQTPEPSARFTISAKKLSKRNKWIPGRNASRCSGLNMSITKTFYNERMATSLLKQAR